MNDKATNQYGLTFEEWLQAAAYPQPVVKVYSVSRMPELRKAWERGTDAAEFAAELK